MSRPLFILRAYNDIDHIAPLIHYYIKKDLNPLVLLNSSTNFDEDPRVKLLISSGKVEFLKQPDHIHERYVNHLGSERKLSTYKYIANRIYYQILQRNTLFGKFIRRFFFDYSDIYFFLKSKNITTLFVEWGNPYNKGINFEKLIVCAKSIGIPIFCLPHGQNIFLNSDIHQNSINLVKKRGLLTDFSTWNFYDYIIVQTKFHKEHFVRFGVDRERVMVWGSMRFSLEWSKINLSLNKKFLPKIKTDTKCNIVFMMPHWVYNVHKENTISLIDKLSRIQEVSLVIKDHTREDTGIFPLEKRSNLLARGNVEFVSDESSVSLIRWSDIVINFGSSIGLEAFLQNKILINPAYLMTNNSAFLGDSLRIRPKNDSDVLKSIKSFLVNELYFNIEEKELNLEAHVFANQKPYNVIEYYFTKINDLIDDFKYTN